MMETYENLVTQFPTTTTTRSSAAYSNPPVVPIDITATNNSSGSPTIDVRTSEVLLSGNTSLLPWDVIGDTFLKQLNGQGSLQSPGRGSGGGNGSGSGVSVIQQLPFAAYQSVAAISTQPTGTDTSVELFQDDGSGGGVGGGGGIGSADTFVSWASTATPSQVFFVVKVVIMCFIIVAAVFGNLLVIVSVMRHRKLR